MEAAHLEINDSIEIREEAGRIVIDRIHNDEYDLSQLLSAIGPDNIHVEFDFGNPSGRELL
jgi:antitoxin MazE